MGREPVCVFQVRSGVVGIQREGLLVFDRPRITLLVPEDPLR